jgi:hypothetical protein
VSGRTSSQQVWLDVCQLVELMPQLRQVSIQVTVRARYRRTPLETCTLMPWYREAVAQCEFLADEARLMEMMEPKLKSHRYLKEIEMKCQVSGILGRVLRRFWG